MKYFFPSAKAMVVAMLVMLSSGCASLSSSGRAHFFPSKENPEFYLVTEHFPYGKLGTRKIVKARIRITLISMPGNEKVLSEIFTVSSVGFIDFEAKMDKRQGFSIQMKDRDSSRTWTAELRKNNGQLGSVQYELILPAER